jgi:hypothetical protein
MIIIYNNDGTITNDPPLDTEPPEWFKYNTHWKWLSLDKLGKVGTYYWSASFISTVVTSYTYHFSHISDFYDSKWNTLRKTEHFNLSEL